MAGSSQPLIDIAMADLSITARDSDAYLSTTGPRGQTGTTNAAQDAQMRAHIQQRQGQLQASSDQATSAWNNQTTFEQGSQDLSNLFDGQSHRASNNYNAANVSARAGPAAMPRTSTGPSYQASNYQETARQARGTQIRGGRQPRGRQGHHQEYEPASLPSRARAASPTAHGTVRFKRGQRQAMPLAPRHREAANPPDVRALFFSPVPGQQPRRPAPGPVMTEAAMIQSQVDALVVAVKSDAINSIKHLPTNGPSIIGGKVMVFTQASLSSIPDKPVIDRGAQWIQIFHATRKAFVKKAFDIATISTKGEQARALTAMKDKFQNFGELFEDVLDARLRAKYYSDVMKKEWEAKEKLDVLQFAIKEMEEEESNHPGPGGLQVRIKQHGKVTHGEALGVVSEPLLPSMVGSLDITLDSGVEYHLTTEHYQAALQAVAGVLASSESLFTIRGIPKEDEEL